MSPAELAKSKWTIGRYLTILEGFRDIAGILETLESREYICELGMLDGDSDFIRLKELAKALQRDNDASKD